MNKEFPNPDEMAKLINEQEHKRGYDWTTIDEFGKIIKYLVYDLAKQSPHGKESMTILSIIDELLENWAEGTFDYKAAWIDILTCVYCGHVMSKSNDGFCPNC